MGRLFTGRHSRNFPAFFPGTALHIFRHLNLSSVALEQRRNEEEARMYTIALATNNFLFSPYIRPISLRLSLRNSMNTKVSFLLCTCIFSLQRRDSVGYASNRLNREEKCTSLHLLEKCDNIIIRTLG